MLGEVVIELDGVLVREKDLLRLVLLLEEARSFGGVMPETITGMKST